MTNTEDAPRYRVILADPPWEYKQRVARNSRHYRSMSNASIAALPVADLVAPDCALLLWATMPNLPVAFDVIQAWGFRYVTNAFTWIKLNQDGTPFRGLGSYTRANAELCLLGLRGRVTVKHPCMSSIMITRRREHSRKPDEQYDRIMALFDGAYIELFARQQWPGWAVYGNQTGKFPAQPFLFGETFPPDLSDPMDEASQQQREEARR